MSVPQHVRGWITTVTIRAMVSFLLVLPGFAQHYTRTDLTADSAATSATAANLDPNLVNSWGLSRSSGSAWWVSDNHTGLSTLYDGGGVPQSLVVTIPPKDANGKATPTGTVFNYTTAFQVAPDVKAIFLFVTEEGTISGWNPSVDLTHALIPVNHSDSAVYKGCAIAMTAAGPRFYATNFSSGKVEVYDGNFQPVPTSKSAFRDPLLKDNFVPFNVQSVGGNLLVTFASRSKGSEDEDHGPGLGATAVFSQEGRLLLRLQSGNWFNAPWGVAAAPADFGASSHRILIGNFGSGSIRAFNAVTGKHEGALLDADGNRLKIDGVWALGFGNDAKAGSALTLFFTSGPNQENSGLLGSIAPVATEQRGNTE
jgi:uncharacterized protein (TIGR03118 family)